MARWRELSGEPLELWRAIIDAWPTGQAMRRETGLTLDELMDAVDELTRIGILTVYCHEAGGYEIRFIDTEGLAEGLMEVVNVH